jgi:hypothetical protein
VSFEFDYSDGFSYDVQAPDRTTGQCSGKTRPSVQFGNGASKTDAAIFRWKSDLRVPAGVFRPDDGGRLLGWIL